MRNSLIRVNGIEEVKHNMLNIKAAELYKPMDTSFKVVKILLKEKIMQSYKFRPNIVRNCGEKLISRGKHFNFWRRPLFLGLHSISATELSISGQVNAKR